MKTETVRSFKTLVTIHLIALYHIPEDTILHSLLQWPQTSHLTVCTSSCTTCSRFWVHVPWCFTRITKVTILVMAMNCLLCSWRTKSPHSARYRWVPQQDTHQTAWIQPRKWHRLRKHNRGKLWLLVICGSSRKGKLNPRLIPRRFKVNSIERSLANVNILNWCAKSILIKNVSVSMWSCVIYWKITYAFEECAASIFRV
jgi:hypothetical protein